MRIIGWFRRPWIITLLTILVIGPLLGSVSPPTANAQPDYESPRYFEETGFWVQGPFREYWETRGGLFVFGYPITRVFEENGLLKQYFERAIFEYHPEYAGTDDEILLQHLGSIRTEDRRSEPPFQPIDVIGDENCDFYPETGHRLCFGFKNFWNEHGGLPNFGYPISEEFDEQNEPPPAGDGQTHTVQYFERTRFEYHPEHQGTPYEVQLGLLGTEYLLQHGAPEGARERQSPDEPPSDPTELGFGYGFNIAWRGDAESDPFHQQTLDRVTEAGFGWIRIQVLWSEFEREPGNYDFTPIDRIVDMAVANDVKVLASVVGAPTWATANGSHGIPADPAPFGAFMEAMADHFKWRIRAYEIWNEQNLAAETGGTVNIESYVNLLKAGYNGVKAAAPGATVVFGGLTPTGVNDPSIAIDDVLYLQQIYAYNNGEIRNYYDVLGVHPGSNNNSPDQMWPDNPGPGGWSDDGSFYFRRVEQLRQVMEANDEAEKDVWLTEFGWTTQNAAPGYEYGEFISEQDQADYLVRAFEIARTEWPWMGAMFVWNLNFSVVVDETDEKGPWSVLNPDWSPRPSYEALKAMPK